MAERRDKRQLQWSRCAIMSDSTAREGFIGMGRTDEIKETFGSLT